MLEGIPQTKKTILSAVKPSGMLTIGNYLGALKNFVRLKDEGKCFFCVADLHTITVDIEPAKLRKNSFDLYSLFLALGLEGEDSTVFVQSHVAEHSQLAWVLNCFCGFGEAQRMTQFKDLAKKHGAKGQNVGLFAYPILMAADILIYNTDIVPVGDDQKQHVEIARTIAQRFNSKYSPTFTMPEPVITKVGARIKSLSDPTAKMGKSNEDLSGVVMIADEKDVIMKKFARAVTDSETEVRFDQKNKPGISNLLTIYSGFSGLSIKQAEEQFKNSSYKEFKENVGELVCEKLKPIQENMDAYSSDKELLQRKMQEGAEKARVVARKTLSKVYRKVGF
ncbi:MAG: tryptophan--tRNA ligase [Firmicutes bacterium]|nr:tryptophan--tRNA ligase [Bacillota bacterium]